MKLENGWKLQRIQRTTFKKCYKMLRWLQGVLLFNFNVKTVWRNPAVVTCDESSDIASYQPRAWTIFFIWQQTADCQAPDTPPDIDQSKHIVLEVCPYWPITSLLLRVDVIVNSTLCDWARTRQLFVWNYLRWKCIDDIGAISVIWNQEVGPCKHKTIKCFSLADCIDL